MMIYVWNIYVIYVGTNNQNARIAEARRQAKKKRKIAVRGYSVMTAISLSLQPSIL